MDNETRELVKETAENVVESNAENKPIEQKFDVINDGNGLRVSTPVVHQAVYNRKQLEEMRAQKTEELRQIIALLSKMDELGIV